MEPKKVRDGVRRDLLGAIACVPGAASLPSQPPKRKLLAIGDVHTKNYQHDAVSHALATVEQPGRRFGLYDTWIPTDTIGFGAVRPSTTCFPHSKYCFFRS